MPVYTTQKGGQPKKNSLTLKLVVIQVRRVAAIMLMLDIFISLLFAVGIAIAYENHAIDTIPPIMQYVDETGNLPDISERNLVADYVPGESFGLMIDSGNKVVNQFRRNINFTTTRKPWLMGQRNVVEYLFTIEADEPGMIYRFVFDIGTECHVYMICMMALVSIELFLIITSIFKARRNVRKALAPIDELTTMARNITRKQQASPVREKIKLDKTIESLNAITGEDLNKRIDVDDEREELQGLVQAINSMLERLDAAYHSQMRFVSDASHELRTPIAVIQGYANLIDRWGKEDEQTLQEAIDAIKSEAENMKELMEQLLFLARSDNQSIPMEFANFNLSDLVSEVCSESRMIDNGHEIKENIQPNVVMRGDSQLVKQAIRIIVDNSIKYTPDNGAITLRVHSADNMAYVSVTDEGIGISGEDLPKVFDRFYRADDSRDRQTGGTGLGLSIANWIVEAHNGHIEVTSRQDVGTRFRLAFPQRSQHYVSGDIKVADSE